MLGIIVAAVLGIVTMALSGHPFMALPSPDGKTVFVSVDSDDAAANGIAVLHRDGEALVQRAFLRLPGTPMGLALSADGSTLFAANAQGVVALSEITAGSGETPHEHYLRIQGDAGTIEVAPSADGRYVFFTNEWMSSVGVAAYEAGASGTQTPWRLVGAIETDRGPVGMALSGRWLYVTSENRPSIVRPCYENGAMRAQGTFRVIDAQRAEVDPEHATAAIIDAGCAPVRVAVSPDGTTAWITQRADRRVTAFDTAMLRDNAGRAERTNVGVGEAPVGIASIKSGTRLLVANSNRFGGNTSSTIDVVDTGAPGVNRMSVVSQLPAGVFPREITESPQHDVVYVTNYGSQTIEMIPESIIP